MFSHRVVKTCTTHVLLDNLPDFPTLELPMTAMRTRGGPARSSLILDAIVEYL